MSSFFYTQMYVLVCRRASDRWVVGIFDDKEVAEHFKQSAHHQAKRARSAYRLWEKKFHAENGWARNIAQGLEHGQKRSEAKQRLYDEHCFADRFGGADRVMTGRTYYEVESNRWYQPETIPE